MIASHHKPKKPVPIREFLFDKNDAAQTDLVNRFDTGSFKLPLFEGAAPTALCRAQGKHRPPKAAYGEGKHETHILNTPSAERMLAAGFMPLKNPTEPMAHWGF